jgi:predicted metal-dependent phosphoesterase TrpH
MVEGPTVLSLDLHVHSALSYDAHEPIELLPEHASDIGLDGFVVTDHDRIAASLEAAELAAEYGLVEIPGVEVSTAQGHLLAVGVDERPARAMRYAVTVHCERELGGAAVVPPPFQRTRHGARRRVLDETVVDAPSPADATVEQVVAALRNGDTSVVARWTPVTKSTVQYGKGALRKVVYELTSRAPLGPAVPRSIAEYWTER